MSPQSRRTVLAGMGSGALAQTPASTPQPHNAPVSSKEKIKITRLETFLVKPRWLFLKIHTDAGIVGLGEPYLEGRAKTSAAAVKEIEPYLIGKDPRHVVHHWQAIYRHTCYHGGLILSSALSGIDQALWDIKGKALGLPVWEMLGGPTRSKVRIYRGVRDAVDLKRAIQQGFTAVKTGPGLPRLGKFIETRANIRKAEEHIAGLRRTAGDNFDIAVDFHGNISPASSKVLIKALEPYQPAWIEDPVQCQNVDVLADVARSTFLPICVGERLTTKWTIREVLEKQAAKILNPDMSHAGGITEVRNIAALAETFYASIAPHCPLGPIALASAIQLAGCIPNFLITEHTTLGAGYLKQPFVMKNGYVDLPTAPGLGIELDENAMADKIGHDWRNRETYDEDDGSVVDW